MSKIHIYNKNRQKQVKNRKNAIYITVNMNDNMMKLKNIVKIVKKVCFNNSLKYIYMKND